MHEFCDIAAFDIPQVDGLYEAARGSRLSIGGVIVSCRDRSLCVEDLRHILVEVHAVAVKGSVLHEGQGAGGHRFQRIPQQYLLFI